MSNTPMDYRSLGVADDEAAGHVLSLVDEDGVLTPEWSEPTEGEGGGSLPASLEVDPDTGALTITLTGTAGDGDFAPALTIKNSDGSTIFSVDSSGEAGVYARSVNATPLNVSDGSNDFLQLFSANEGFALGLKAPTVPTDGAIGNSFAALWFDDTNGSPKLMVKARQADGTVVTGELALT